MSDDRINRIEDKIDKMLDIAIKQEVNLGELKVSVVEHVRRADLQEENIKMLRADVEPLKASALKTKTIAMVVWKVFIYVIVPLSAAVIATMHFVK